MRRLLVLVGLLLTLGVLAPLSPAAAEDVSKLPRPSAYVNDFAGVFNPDVKAQLEDTLRLFQEETTVELAVVTVPDLGGDTIEGYAVRLFERWGIGKKDVDNGVLLLYARDDRKVRIEVGYGMEPHLTDGQAGRILDADVIPDLKDNKPGLGLIKGAKSIARAIKDSGYQPGSVRPPPSVLSGLKIWIAVALVIATIYFASYMARTKEVMFGAVWGAIAGGIVGWLIGGLLAVILGIAITTVVGLLLDVALSSAYKNQVKSGMPTQWHRSMGGFSGMGGWGGGSGGGGGFGGFGGGRSGGGGSSRGF